MVSLEKLSSPQNRRLLRNLGISGIGKSVYHSLRHTNRPDSLLIHPNVITTIESGSELDIDTHFAMGAKNVGATHPELGKSALTVRSSGSLTVPSTENIAEIGPCSVLTISGDFEMGGSYINSHSRVLCADKITIGDDCAISWNVELLDTDRHQLTVDGESRPVSAPIEIGNHVWIGHDVLVNKGVTIGDGAVIGSGSVVISDIPPNTLAAGNPATVLKEDVSWSH